MKITELYNINRSQAEIDFIDIDPSCDIPLFLDPFFLSLRTDNWSIEARLILHSFFQKVIDYIRNDQEDQAKELFSHLHEPNTTCLGMSTGTPSGKGVGSGDTDNIYASLLGSDAIRTGLIQDIEDNILFVEKFGKDKLSDMVTNIITKSLIEYTQSQCNLYGIPLTSGIPSGYYWERSTEQWESVHTDMLVHNGQVLLMVPKGIVSFSKAYTPSRYYQHFILNFLQGEHLRINSALVQTSPTGRRFVTKRSLIDSGRYPPTKNFLRQFTEQHPEILEKFKDEVEVNSLVNNEITEIDVRSIARQLIMELESIDPGNDTASDYHKLIISILHLIFYPYLINPVKEREIHQGRKRIDISFDNAARDGIFYRLPNSMNLFCPYILVECKNYSTDISNPELDQLSSRFSMNRGRVGLLLCRQFDNMDLFIERCRDTYRDGRGLVIPIVDDDLKMILTDFSDWNRNGLEQFLSNRIRDITLD